MMKTYLLFTLSFAFFGQLALGNTLRCGIGSEVDKLEHVRSAELSRKNKEENLSFRGENAYNLSYYQVRIFYNYEEEGKDVAELSLISKSGPSSISSQKVSALSEGDVFTLYLIESRNRYVQLLCFVLEDENL